MALRCLRELTTSFFGLLAATAFLATLLGSAVAADKVVRVWHTETNPQSQKAIANIIQRFEASHPGIKVEAEALAWGDLEGKIMASLAAGSPPELSHGQPITCSALQQQGMLLPLDDVVQAIGEDNIWDQIKRVCRADGKYYGLVHAAGTSLLIYRKDWATEKGVKPPKTWADLLDNAKALTMDTNGDGKTDVYGMTIPGDNLFINIMMGELIKANGGGLFDDKNRPRFTEPQMIETLEFWKALTAYLPPGWEGHGYRETFANMYGQKAAMMFQGYGRGASLIEQYAPKDMQSTDHFDVWVKPHGPSGKTPAAQVDQEPWMLFKDAKNPEEAKAFLKFFYQDKNYLEYIQSVPIHFFPITKSLRRSDAYAATPMIQRWSGWLAAQEHYLDNDLVKPTMVVEWDDLNTKPYLMQILGSGVLRDMVMEVTVEGVDPKTAADRAQKKAEALVKKAGFAKW
ncbi:MAG: sugar ABC transporter substrate-binding protein [Alphaproteobacteria bacterium]|nr:sugar ABC transporter substrate-binding protein [Alphaproteobacteria bacterium]